MKLHFQTKPWPHQMRVLKRMVRQRGGGLNVPMRWGKSWIGVNWSAALYHLEDVRRVLIITVPSGIGVWEDQIAEHCPIPYTTISYHGEVVDGSEDGHSDQIRFMLVDYPNLYSRVRTGEGASWVPVTNETLKRFKAQAIIADESHHLGNPTAVTSKHAYALARPVPFRLFMTGTMFHRKPFFVFGQMKFLDDGKTFGTAFTHFKKRIAVFGGYGGYEVMRYKNLRWMMDQIRPKVYIERTVPKRPPISNPLRFELTDKHLDAYEKMAQHKVLEVGDETLISDIVLTQHLRLLQIAGGFVKLPSGRYACVGTCKLEMCKGRLEEYMEQDVHKVIVGCRFIPELSAVAKLGKKAGFQVVLFHGGVPKGVERRKRIAFFQQTSKPTLFISQIATGKESIDLSAADTTLWYSLPESFVDYDQFDKRKEKYNEKRTLMNDFLLARGTHDEVAMEAMKLKMDVARYITTRPALVERLTVNRKSRRRVR